MNTEPVRTVLLPIALGAFAAAAQAFIEGANTRGIITAVLGVLIVAAQEYARSQVTPAPSSSRLRDQAGMALLEALIVVFVILVILVVLFRLL